jgi:hypothetical protein
MLLATEWPRNDLSAIGIMKDRQLPEPTLFILV